MHLRTLPYRGLRNLFSYLTAVSRRMSAFVSTVPARATPKIDCLHDLYPFGYFMLAPGGSTMAVAARLAQLSPNLQQRQDLWLFNSEVPSSPDNNPDTKELCRWNYLKMLWSVIRRVGRVFLRFFGCCASDKQKKDFSNDDHIGQG